jgi:hypothetical protein
MPDITSLAELRAFKERQEAPIEPTTKAPPSIKIDSSEAFPPPNKSDGGIYPWGKMRVGESFLVTDRTMAAMSRPVQKRQKVSSHRYSCRTVEGGVRVWRIA